MEADLLTAKRCDRALVTLTRSKWKPTTHGRVAALYRRTKISCGSSVSGCGEAAMPAALAAAAAAAGRSGD